MNCPCHKKADGTPLRHSMSPEECKESDSVYLLAQAQRKDFIKHLRPNMNEWIREDYEEWAGQVDACYKRSLKHNLICQEAYQDIMAMVWEVGGQLIQEIRDHEEQEDYIARLCPQRHSD